MIEDIVEVGGDRWRVKAKTMEAALNEIAHARVTGSVGSSTIDDNTLVGGTKELRAEVHRLDADGNDVQPYGRPLPDQERKDVADYLAEALRESPAFQNLEGWSSKAEVAESVNTSGCPLITFTLDDGQAFNITITRKRA